MFRNFVVRKELGGNKFASYPEDLGKREISFALDVQKDIFSDKCEEDSDSYVF